MSIQALLVEREGYKRRNMKGRVAEVDAAIKALGGVVVEDAPQVERPAPPAVETAVKPSVKK